MLARALSHWERQLCAWAWLSAKLVPALAITNRRDVGEGLFQSARYGTAFRQRCWNTLAVP